MEEDVLLTIREYRAFLEKAIVSFDSATRDEALNQYHRDACELIKLNYVASKEKLEELFPELTNLS